MGDGDPELGGGQRTGERRVRVAVDEDRVGSLGVQDRLEGHDHPAGLFRVRPGGDLERVVGTGKSQLDEECPGQPFIPVLPGIDEHVVVTRTKFGQQCGRLDELGTRADHADDLHRLRTPAASPVPGEPR